MILLYYRKMNQPGISTVDIQSETSGRKPVKKGGKPRNTKGTRAIQKIDAIDSLQEMSNQLQASE